MTLEKIKGTVQIIGTDINMLDKNNNRFAIIEKTKKYN